MIKTKKQLQKTLKKQKNCRFFKNWLLTKCNSCLIIFMEKKYDKRI